MSAAEAVVAWRDRPSDRSGGSGVQPARSAAAALLGRRSLLTAGAATALTAPWWSSPPRPQAWAMTAVSSPARLTRSSGGRLLRRGVAWRAGGANEFQLVLNDYPHVRLMAHDEIDALLDRAVALGCGLVRAHTLGVNVGPTPGHLVHGVSGSTSPVVAYNPAAWDVMDYAVSSAGARGIYLMVPLTDELGYYHGGKRSWVNFRRPGSCSSDPSVTSASSWAERVAEDHFYTDPQIRLDFETYVADWLEHVNAYTGLAYKDDPTIAVVETGNEIWTSKDHPTWGPALAAHIKSVAPDVLVADGTACDGQELIAEHLASPYLDIHGCHPYAAFDAATVTTQAVQCEAAGKAYVVGEYPWSKAGAPAIEAAARARPNCAATALWSLQNDADLHDQAAAYGTDDVSLYYPGKDDVQASAVKRLQVHAAAMVRGFGPAARHPSFDDAFVGSGALDGARFATRLSADSRTARYRGRLVMKAGALGGYADKVTVASRAPAATDRTVMLALTPADTRESYLRVWLRAASSEAAGGTLDFGGDGYWIEINSWGNWVLRKRVAGVQTTLVAQTAIRGFGAGVPVHVEATLVGSSITCRLYTGRTRPTRPSGQATDSSIRMGWFGFVLANGAETTCRTWHANNWVIA